MNLCLGLDAAKDAFDPRDREFTYWGAQIIYGAGEGLGNAGRYPPPQPVGF